MDKGQSASAGGARLGTLAALFRIRHGLAIIISIGIALSATCAFVSGKIHFAGIKAETVKISEFCSENFKALLLQYARAAALSADVISSRNGQTDEVLSRFHMILDMMPVPARMAIAKDGRFTELVGTFKSGNDAFAKRSLDEIRILDEDAMKAASEHETIVSLAPIMKDEGISFAVIHPVYEVGGYGSGHLWGHVILVAKPGDVLSEISQLITPFGSYGVSYTLRSRFYPGGMRIFGDQPGSFAASTSFNFLGHEWTVSASPRVSWHAFAAQAWILVLGLLLTALLATLWSYGRFLVFANRSLGEANLELKRLSETDPLTGACNRQGGKEAIESLLSSSGGNGVVMCVTDLDDFKRINDIYGHQAGDEVLCDMVRGLRKALLGRGVLSRMGGDEFVMALEGGDQQALDGLAAFAAKPHFAKFSGAMVQYSISIGAARLPDDAQDLHSLGACADLALYHTKLSGKCGLSFYKKENTLSDRIEMGFSRYEIQEGFPCGLLICKSGGRGEILYANRRLLTSLGFSSLAALKEACGGYAASLFHSEDSHEIEELAAMHTSRGSSAIGCRRMRILTGGGGYKAMFAAGQMASHSYYGDLWYVVLLDDEDLLPPKSAPAAWSEG